MSQIKASPIYDLDALLANDDEPTAKPTPRVTTNKDVSELVLTPNSGQMDEQEYDAAAIRARYLLDTND